MTERNETPSSGLSAAFSPWKGEKGQKHLQDSRDAGEKVYNDAQRAFSMAWLGEAGAAVARNE